MVRCGLLLIAGLAITGCSSAFIAALDSAAGGGNCRYSADGGRTTLDGESYTFTFGGYCDYWEGKLANYSGTRTIRCAGEYQDGSGRLRAVYAKPGETTGWINMGPIDSSAVETFCQVWESEPEIAADAGSFLSQRQYFQGDPFLRVLNNASYQQRCTLSDGDVEVLTEAWLAPGEATEWIALSRNPDTMSCEKSPGNQYVIGLLRSNGYAKMVPRYKEAADENLKSRLIFSETLRWESKNNAGLWEMHEHLDYRFWLSTVSQDELVEWALQSAGALRCEPQRFCTVDDKEYFFEVAAKAGNNTAKVRLGALVWRRADNGNDRVLREEAISWWEDAYDNGASYADLQLVARLWAAEAGALAGTEPEAIKWLQRARERGSPDAERLIAEARLTMPALDMQEQGLNDMKKLANGNNAQAAYTLGLIYENGIYVDADQDQALRWFQKGWDLGHYDAFLYTATKLMAGSEEDQKRAFDAFSPLGSRDTFPAFYLGVMYRDGIGTEVDWEKALHQFEVAVSLNHPEAAAHAEELKRRMAGQSSN